MHSTTSLWNTIVNGDYSVLTTVSINGNSFDYSSICELKTTQNLLADQGDYGYPCVGDCVSSQIDLTLRRSAATDAFPRAAKIEVFVNVTNGTSTSSDNIKKGTYYIDTREISSASSTIYDYDTITITGYDAMMKTERNYYLDDGDQGYWPRTDIDIVEDIADRIGVSLNSAVSSIISGGYSIEYPGYGDEGLSLREVLANIGAMYCGNWYIDDDGKLAIMQLNESRSVDAIISKYGEAKTAKQATAYDRVMINITNDDNESAYVTSPSISGGYVNWEASTYYASGKHVVHDSYYYVCSRSHTSTATFNEDYWTKENILMFDCPLLINDDAQDVADDVFDQIDNYCYTGLELTDAIINPALQIGDKITAGTTTTYIFNLEQEYTYLFTASITAPFENEVDHEFNYSLNSSSKMEQTLNSLKTSFTVQNGKIEGLIEGEIHTYIGATPPTGISFHDGDLFYCNEGGSTYNANTWYRWTKDDSSSSWVETTASVAVAPDWSEEETYTKGDVVTGTDGKWYTSIEDDNEGHEPPDDDWWEECTTITETAKSQILQELDTIQLSVEQGERGSYIQIKSNGINWKTSGDSYFETNNAHFSGTLTAAKVVARGDDILVTNSDGSVIYGKIGYGSGNDGTGTTNGVVMMAYTENSEGEYVLDEEHYFIVTDEGVRMQSGDYSIYVTNQGCFTKYGSNAAVRIGTAVFG